MSPADQLVASADLHAKIPWLLDLLSFWEAMDSSESPSLTALREEVGTQELRDLAVTLFPVMLACFKLDGTEPYGAFDWEWQPAWIAAIDWSKASYHLVPDRYHLALPAEAFPTPEQVRAIAGWPG